MSFLEGPVVESEAVGDFARVMRPVALRAAPLPSGAAEAGRLNLRQEDVKNGLGQLVLTLVKLLHELLEKQAIRRIETGSLTEPEIERLGVTLMRQAQEIRGRPRPWQIPGALNAHRSC